MLKKFANFNPLVKILFSLFVLALIGVMTIGIVLNSPFYKEGPWVSPKPEAAYTFENWNLDFGYINIYFDKGHAILGYRNSDLNDLLIKGDGQYELQIHSEGMQSNEQVHRRGSLEAVYIPVGEEKFEILKGDVIFNPLDKKNTDLNRNYDKYFSKAKELLVHLDTFAVSRIIPPEEETHAVYLFGQNYHASYLETDEVIFSTTESERVNVETSTNTSAYPPSNFYFSTAGYLLLYLAILILLIAIFTVDLYVVKTASISNTLSVFNLSFIILGLFLLKWVQFDLELLNWQVGGFYLLMTAVLYTVQSHIIGRFQIENVLSFKNWGRKLVLTLVLGTVMIGFESLRIPSGLTISSLENTVPILPSIFLLAFFREFVLRGFLLGSLENYFSPHKSLVVSILIIGGIHFALFFLTRSYYDFGFPFNSLLELVILPIFAAAFLGFLYQRTRNILWPTLLQIWIFIGQEILVF